MNHRRLGNSGLLVSELALGTMIFGEKSERGVAAADARQIVSRYLDLGGNHFDIADVYAGGEAEAIVGDVVKAARDRLVLTTKVRWPARARERPSFAVAVVLPSAWVALLRRSTRGPLDASSRSRTDVRSRS